MTASRRLGKQDAPPEARKALERAFEVVGDVLEQRVPAFAACGVLKAAGMLAEAIAGPAAQRLEHTGADGSPLQVFFTPIPEGDE